MTITLNAITPQALAALQAGAAPFTLLDVRRDMARAQDGTHIAGAAWCNPADWLNWKDSISKTQPAVVYCAKGHEISQAMTAALSALGVNAVFLEGGLALWKSNGLTVQPIAAATELAG